MCTDIIRIVTECSRGKEMRAEPFTQRIPSIQVEQQSKQ